MGRKSFVAALLTLQLVACLALPQQHQKPIVTHVEDPASFIMGEGLVEAQLKIKPSSHGENKLQLDPVDPNYTSYSRPVVEESLKSENDPVDFETEDELIQPSKLKEPAGLSSSNERTTLRLPSGGAVNVASSNPIYITIPIYINKAEGQPLRLSVGGQSIPLGPRPNAQHPNMEPISPTSQFNRLLQHDEMQLKHSKPATRKTSKKKKLHHSSDRYTKRKAHRPHSNESRKSLALEDRNQSSYYKFYF